MGVWAVSTVSALAGEEFFFCINDLRDRQKSTTLSMAKMLIYSLYDLFDRIDFKKSVIWGTYGEPSLSGKCHAGDVGSNSLQLW